MGTPGEVVIFLLGMVNALLFQSGTISALMEYRIKEAGGKLPDPTLMDTLLLFGAVLVWNAIFVALPLYLVS